LQIPPEMKLAATSTANSLYLGGETAFVSLIMGTSLMDGLCAG